MFLVGLLREAKEAMRICSAPYKEILRTCPKPEQKRRFVLRFDTQGRSGLKILLTFLSLCLQKEKWTAVVPDRPRKSLPLPLQLCSRITCKADAQHEGAYFGHITAGSILFPNALTVFAGRLERDADALFTDQYLRDFAGGRDVERFVYRPGYSREFLRSSHYLGDLLVFRRELLTKDEQRDWLGKNISVYAAALRLSDRTQRFLHLPFATYCAPGNWTEDTDTVRDLAEYLRSAEPGAVVSPGNMPGTHRIQYPLPEDALVSIIIPSHDHADDLKKCIDSIRARTQWKQIELLIAENGSTEDQTFAYYDELRKEKNVRILNWEHGFSFAAICNWAAKQASGRFLLFLNNDMEVISPEWIGEMLMHARRPEVGAVGAKLLYPDGTVQHGGVLMGVGGIAGHAYKYLAPDDTRNMDRLNLVHSCSAVTGACLMIEKEKFERLGGMEEKLAVAYNDVDLCLRLTEQGYTNIFTPYAVLYHYESKSRGPETGANYERFLREAGYMERRWADLIQNGDPYLHPAYSRKNESFTLE